jgi:hypothetical protein
MKKIRNIGCTIAIITIVAFGCKKAYEPAIVSSKNSYLVVEGAINSGTDSTFIKLSHTVSIASKTTVQPELNATVAVEGDQNTSYPLKEIGNGNYACAGLKLDNTHKYRLSIKTSGNKQYLSDYVAVLNSPPIDSIHYDTYGTVFGPGLNIYVNTHDNSKKVQYYRWEYEESWVFHSNFNSYFKSNGDTVLGRDLTNDNITFCWHNDTSSSIVIGSSAKLAQNIISNNPIISIESSSEKVGNKYSILVRQYALTADAYNFYSNLKKNTEQLGSIFDALPSEISGNIHSVSDPSEIVIGYITVGSTNSQRIFIPNQVLPQWATKPFYTNCTLAFDTKNPCCYYVFPQAPYNQVDAYINYNKEGGYSNPLIPVDAIGMPGHPPIGYTAASRECVDCTLRGTNKKPAFWQ